MTLVSCTKCKKEKPKSYFYKRKSPKGHDSWCKECTSKQTTEYRKTRPERLKRSRDYHLLSRYKMSTDDYDNILSKQKGGCAICGTDKPGGKNNRFHIDHCHNSNKIRGLLCCKCNHGLGNFRDSKDNLYKAIEYLDRAI